MMIDFAYRVSKFTCSWVNGKKRLWIITILAIILFILIAFEFQAKEKIGSNVQEEKPNEVARKLEEFMKNLKGE